MRCLVRIPPELGNLDNLADLNLMDNQLSGPIPPELGNLESLEYMYLRDNALSGPIPPALGSLNSLRILSLGHNRKLAGPLPPALIQTKLRSLEMASTDLCIPSTPAFHEWLSGISTKSGAVLLRFATS